MTAKKILKFIVCGNIWNIRSYFPFKALFVAKSIFQERSCQLIKK